MNLQQELDLEMTWMTCKGFCFEIELFSFFFFFWGGEGEVFKLRVGNHMINGVTNCALYETIQS